MTIAVAMRESKLPVRVGIELAGSQADSVSGAEVAIAVTASRTAWLIIDSTWKQREVVSEDRYQRGDQVWV